MSVTRWTPTKMSLQNFRDLIDHIGNQIACYKSCASDKERQDTANRIRKNLWELETCCCGRASERDTRRAELFINQARQIVGEHP